MNIKELAEQANGEHSHPGGVDWYWDELEKFAELVAAHALMNIDPSKFIGGYQEGFEAGVAKEREECAKVCEELLERPSGYQGRWEGYGKFKSQMTGQECADAIRARSKA